MALPLVDHPATREVLPIKVANLLRLMLTRASVSPKRLMAPGPSRAEIEMMVTVALTAPDHAGLRPWRFIWIADETRSRLAELFVSAKMRASPHASPEELCRERERAFRSPTVIAVIARLQRAHPKVHVREQYASVGAAIQNLLLAAHALGYGAIMLSGRKTRDTELARHLGLAGHEELMGFACMGTPAAKPLPKHRPDCANHLTRWIPDGLCTSLPLVPKPSS